MMAFIGNHRGSKEHIPVCLPRIKAWEWHTGNAIADFTKVKAYYAVKATKGTLWMPGANDDPLSAVPVPNLLAIPNALINLLRTLGPAINLHDVLATVDNFIQNSRHPQGMQWECVQWWCLVACQAAKMEKSKVFLDSIPITIDDKEFDHWVGNKLDITLGPRPSGATSAITASAAGTQAMDYLAMSKIQATTIGANMMQFSQAMTPILAAAGTAGNDMALATGKSFDQEQIARLWDACGVRNSQQIPPIWVVIQGSKGKSLHTCWAHLAKCIELWCCSHYIDRDKSIFLDSKFFKDLVTLRFNPEGPVAQYQLAALGMSMLACRSLSAVEAKYHQDYKEAAAHTQNMRRINVLLKGNHGKMVASAGTYMELKLNMGSYCGLLWSLFGDHCNYYKELLKLCQILDWEECFTIWEAYTKDVCVQITWAIIDKGRLFFGRNHVALDFALGAQFYFSTFFLKGIMDIVCNALVIQRATFPREWLSPVVPEVTYGAPRNPPPPPAHHECGGWHLPRH
jgi:hypothetical protein